MWNCKQCGDCCRHLTGTSTLGKFGMTVLPQEKKRLKGAGFQPFTSNGKQITLYQFTTDVCPFLHGNACTIYEKRPVSCRMFPLSPLGLLQCSHLEVHDSWPTETYEAVKEYAVQVQPILREAKWLFNLEIKKWQKCEVKK